MTDVATDPGLRIADSAAARIRAIKARDGTPDALLRIAVNGGGCSGFQYQFSFDEGVSADDVVFEHGGVKVVVDRMSLDLIKGSEVSFVEDLVGSYFKMSNPNAKSSCGCGTSFSI
ncbi:MAG: iron-sulfur cluster insertion protein ErpA [Alphaproteobacteria bacterium]